MQKSFVSLLATISLATTGFAQDKPDAWKTENYQGANLNPHTVTLFVGNWLATNLAYTSVDTKKVLELFGTETPIKQIGNFTVFAKDILDSNGITHRNGHIVYVGPRGGALMSFATKNVEDVAAEAAKTFGKFLQLPEVGAATTSR